MTVEEKNEFPPGILMGRFNFLTFGNDQYNIIFVPKFGNSISIIARNLTRNEMEDIMPKLNGPLNELWKIWNPKEEVKETSNDDRNLFD